MTESDRMSSVPLMNLHERRNHAPDPDYDWSDQEVEEFSRDPLESVLMQMRLWPQAISRQQCVQSALFFSAIALCVGFVLAYLLFLLFYPVANCKFLDALGVSSQLMSNVDVSRIRVDLSSGTGLVEKMKESRLDSVVVDNSTVVLSESDPMLFNGVEVKAKGGEFVYVNYGRPQDFGVLTSKEIIINDRIIVARLTASSVIPLWEIVHRAQLDGAIGLVLFSHDDTYGLDDLEDPLNLFPATIPIQFISYDKAIQLLTLMKGVDDAPADWNIENKRLKLESNLNQEKLYIYVHNRPENHKLLTVIGVIKGKLEPDRVVLIGSERHVGKNTWGLGLLLELARAYGSLSASGRLEPRRSIAFCSWDFAHGKSLGVANWIQEHSDWLEGKVVTYMDIQDVANGSWAWTVPSLMEFVNKSMAKTGSEDVIPVGIVDDYVTDENWRQNSNFSDASKYFLERGIPVVQLNFNVEKSNSKFPTSEMNSLIEISSNLMNSVLLPFNTASYVSIFNATLKKIEKNADKISIQKFIENFANFAKTVIDFKSMLKSTKFVNPFEIRALNDQMMMAERALSRLSVTDACKTNTKLANSRNLISCDTKIDYSKPIECHITKLTSILNSAFHILRPHF